MNEPRLDSERAEALLRTDRVLTPDEEAALAAYLASDPPPDTELDDVLRQAFAGERESGLSHADAMARFVSELPPDTPPTPWLPFIAGLAVGFIIALGILPRPAASERPVVPPSAEERFEEIVRVLQVRGPVETWSPHVKGSEPVAVGETIASGSTVVADAGGLCELQVGSATLRLGPGSRWHLPESGDPQLETGRAWFRSDRAFRLRVGSATLRGVDATVEIEVGGDSTRYMGFRGIASVEGGSGEPIARVEEGQRVEVRGAEVTAPVALGDVDRAATWMLPLLPATDPRVERQLVFLCSQLGRSKLDGEIEGEIRAFGGQAAPSLVAYLRGGGKKLPSSDQRARIAGLLADLAGRDVIASLIDLLADDEPAVRSACASALLRVSGRRVDEQELWRSTDVKARSAAIEAWRDWYERESRR